MYDAVAGPRCVLSRRNEESYFFLWVNQCANSNRKHHEYAPTIPDPCPTWPSWRSGGVSRTESTGHPCLRHTSWDSACR
jgi:hypothetical protein